MGAPQRNKQLPKPIDFDQLYPGRFLKSGELLGEKRTFTIVDVEIDELEGEKGKKIQGVLFLKETDKQILLNKTNGLCLKGMFGKRLESWKGKRFTIYQDLVRFGPDMVDGIRIWGSPDIERDMDVIINLPKRKPITMQMHKVALGQAPAHANAPAAAPTVAEYEGAKAQADFDALEVRRKEHWGRLSKPDKEALKKASDDAGWRLSQPADRTPFTTASAIEALKACTTEEQRATTMAAIVDDFDARNEELPLEVEDCSNVMREKLASGQLF